MVYQKLRDSPLRKAYREGHPNAFAWYKDVPLGIQTGQLAGVGE